MNEQQHSPGTDHVSDPAHVPGDGWVDEGGASHLGPATHLTHDQDEADTEEPAEGSLEE